VGRIRRACDGMASESNLGERGELVGGMLLSLRSDCFGDMWCRQGRSLSESIESEVGKGYDVWWSALFRLLEVLSGRARNFISFGQRKSERATVHRQSRRQAV
jgi:hypothetical protein